MEPATGRNHVHYHAIQSENSESASSSQGFLNANMRPTEMNPVLNYSIQTGEEFALEFMRDRVNPRMPFIPYSAGDPNLTTGYLELKGVLGISHTGSKSGSDVSMLNVVERGSKDLERKTSFYEGTSNYGSVSSLPQTNSNRGGIRDYASSSASDISSLKIKILCSFGGKILPRPSDGKLRYVGGDTRIIRIRRDISWQELWQKTIALYNETCSIKYQLPGEDLDALVSVSSDEDLLNMMEECNVLGEGEGSKKLRMFLFSLSDLDDTHFGLANSGGDSEIQFVVAVNGMDMGSRRGSSLHGLGSSLANNLNELDGQNAEMNTSRTTTDFVGVNVTPSASINVSSSVLVSSQAMLPSSYNAYETHIQMHQGQPKHHGEAKAKTQQHVPVSQSLSDKPPVESSVQLNSDEHVSQQGGCNEGQMSNTMDIQNQQSQVRNPMPKGDSSVKQEVDHGNIRSLGNEGSSGALPGAEQKFLPKPKMSKERHQDEEQGSSPLDAASMERASKCNDKDDDSYASNEALLSSGAGSDLIDLSYLEPPVPPPRVYHSERIPRGQAELNRLTKSDDSLGSQFLFTHSRSDVGPQDFILESVEKFHTEDVPSQSELPPISTRILSCTKPQSTEDALGNGKSKQVTCEPINDNKGINESQILKSACETNTAVVNDNNVQFDKPAETRSQFRLHADPATNHPEYSRGERGASDSTANNAQVYAQSAAPNVSRTEQGDIIIDVNDRFPRDFLSDIFTRAMMSEDLPGIGGLPQDGAVLSLNIANHEPQHWSFFQKLARDEFPQDVSLIDQDQLAFSSRLPKVEEASMVHDIARFQDGVSGSELDSKNTFVEDKEKDTPLVTGSSSISLQSHYDPSQVNVSESMQFVDMVEEMRMPDSEYEVETRNVGLPSIGPSLEDLDISSLQIIRNEDLEELRELGSGTFGTVYHGKWRGTDVAIKRIKKSCFAGRSSEQERLTIEFWREADILSKLHHPNVVAFYGVVQDGPGGTLATVTEFMVDGSLRHVLLRKDRHLDHRKKLIIAMDAAFGMEYLHSKNIVHFDLKCDNLLVNMKDPSRPICKVGDFGLSKIKRNTLVSGGVRGTLPWMAPELLNGSSNKVSEKVDVFSFGIVLWEILTGEEPYANMHYGAIIGGIVSNTLRPPIPRDCDGEWRRLMEQCWAPNPMVRPSFTEITSQLRVMYHTKGHKGS
ncbi:uncharacterized protein LOC112499803 isoform X1 [Cynara cardunculus var. scolymus]|uniref:uncharacterized protein LOC112499803 isoform X1 n=2 Tax=Cynara cardunculus var. scolymus TaxID=59895 RepID=UPI000D624E04|nr:uncharacterized protein LOC112499803 isoform X1 [Cynara cardunculus var. scolymus]XP_024958838.1 uncharacterized protein LOC112499803 isoform X1 [Cynara cardunculus var. scolymus]XP_024958839.1 uncharacterized protein LOC112499803 isoform X1 [Cynara cardunculus var. scolymus]